MHPEYVFVVNAFSGGGKGEAVARLLNKILPEYAAFCGGKSLVLLTNQVDKELSHDALARAKVVIAVGGDGTAHHLIPHLLKGQPPPALGLIPMGTSNDLARALGVSVNENCTDEQTLRKTLSNLLDSQQSGLDVLSVNDSVFFSNYFSIGLDAIIVRDFDTARKSWWAGLLPPGRATNNFLYFLMGLKHAAFFIGPPIEIDLCDHDKSDQVRIHSRRRAIIISNLPVYAGGCRISGDSRKDDGLFEITIIRSAYEYLRLIASRFLPFLHPPHGLVQYRTRRVMMRLSSIPPMQVDGEKCSDHTTATPILTISFHASIRVLSPKATM